MSFVFKYCFLFCACILAVSASVLRDNALYRLDIVHYNDFHDRFEETSVAYPICQKNDTSCIGGFARLYHEIQALLQEKPDALVLNAGDTFQGTYWYSLLKWKISQEFINMIPNDAHALGNHEFDDGVAGLVPYIKALKAPVVAANLIAPEDSKLYGLYKPYVIVERNGKKIGIIGLITTRTQYLSKSAGVTFSDPITTVQEQARLLTDQGVDIIIVLSHCGLNVDQKIAEKVGENIDVIVGGHTHSLLWNGEAPSNESVAGPYPVIVENDTGHKVLIVTASAFSKYLGNISVYFDEKGELHHFEGTPVFLNRSIPEDPKIKALLQPHADELHKVVNEVVGFSTGDLLTGPCGPGECALGNLIADAFRTSADYILPSGLSNVVLLENNNIRTSISKGEITRGAVINIMPFTNKVVTVTVKGRYILDALQKSVQSPWVAKPYTGPHTAMISGMKVKINTTSAEVLEALITSGNENLPLEPDQDYQLTTLDFLAEVAFENVKKYGRNLKFVGKDITVIEDFIRKLSPITPYIDNRLTLVS